MPKAKGPLVRELDRRECEALLRRNNVGRVAFSFRDRVDIEPIHYVYSDGTIYGRTAPGTKLLTLARNPWVAFEVDEVKGLFRWQSVVAHGTFYRLDPEGSDREQQALDRAVELLQGLVPQAFTADDPTPARTVVFRVIVDTMRGLAAEGRETGVGARHVALGRHDAGSAGERGAGSSE